MDNGASRLIYSDEVDKYGELLAIVDDSEGCCEVDITELWKKDNIYFLLTASGCSCWAGEFESREFDSLDTLEADLRGDKADKYMYNPSLVGLQKLLEQARASI